MLQVHPRTVLSWLRSGRLQGLQIDRVWRIPRYAIEGKILRRSEPDHRTVELVSDDPADASICLPDMDGRMNDALRKNKGKE